MPDFYDKIEKSWLQLAPPVGPLSESLEPSTSAKRGGDFSETLAESAHSGHVDWEPTNTTPSPRALIPYQFDGKSSTWTSEQIQEPIASFRLTSPHMEPRSPASLQESPDSHHEGQNVSDRSKDLHGQSPENPESPRVYSNLKRKKDVAETKGVEKSTAPLRTSDVILQKATFQSELLWRKQNPKPEDFESQIRSYIATLFSQGTGWEIKMTEGKLNQRWKRWGEIKRQRNYSTDELVLGSISEWKTFARLYKENSHPRLQILQKKSHSSLLTYHTTTVAGNSLLKDLGLEKEEGKLLQKLHRQWFCKRTLVDGYAKNLFIKLNDQMILRIVDFANFSTLLKISLLNETFLPPPFEGKAKLAEAQKRALSFLKNFWRDLNIDALENTFELSNDFSTNKEASLFYNLFLAKSAASQRATPISWYVFEKWLKSENYTKSLNLELTAVLKWALNNNLMQEAIYHKAADDNANAKPLSNKEVYSLLNSLRSEVQSLKLACSSDAAEVQSLHMQLLSPPPPGASFQPLSHVSTSAYNCFMQEPYRAANHFGKLQGDGSNFLEWVASLNHILCVAFNFKASIEDFPSLLDRQLPQENQASSHFLDASIPHSFALCISVIPPRETEKEFFDTIKAQCCPGSCFHKLKAVCELLHMLMGNNSNAPKSNTSIFLLLHCTFAMFKKLGIKADKLKGLLAQATCRTPPTLDQTAFNQLITAAILSKGDEKPSSTFVGQVIINASQQGNEQAQELSPFVYRLSNPPEPPAPYLRPRSPYNPRLLPLTSEVCQPPNHLVDRFGTLCFHYRRAGHWHADCPHTRGVAHPNPQPPSPTPF
ncbi:hypothetical protein O181_002249 [Austropuccinia psidii MF-1]|uniref:Uncharacterized protein n=1 Tax=Austropuccinia psidii MF-1 TaxID=1389203 RepID=A0A9Q3GCN6_9BASI|nr:hypothetical protein [Austropuccinia psidii MF-1]